MKSIYTELSSMEKGEDDDDNSLLSDDLVKPLRTKSIKKKPFSLCRCLCWTLAILVGFFLFTLLTITAGTIFWTRHQVKRLTVKGMQDLPQPPLPVAPVPRAELEVFKDEAKLFWDQMRAGIEPTQDFVVTQEHMNGLIAHSDFLRGHAFVHVSEGQWKVDLALPVDKLPGGKGRYFVGEGKVMTTEDNQVVTEITPKHSIEGLDFETILSMTMSVFYSTDRSTLRNTPMLNLEYGQFMNWLVPQDWIDRRGNLISCNNIDKHDDDFDRRDCQELMAPLGRLESITVQDGKIVFTPYRNGGNNGPERRLEESVGLKLPSIQGFTFARRVLGGLF